jgi:uncharacterized oligopeptide transporter (OPT) family protein
LLKLLKGYQAFISKGKMGFATGFAMDTFLMPSPYASSFGGFVELMTAMWFALGGILSSFAKTMQEEVSPPRDPAVEEEAGREEMSTTSLVGGGLIAGDSLGSLVLGVSAILVTVNMSGLVGSNTYYVLLTLMLAVLVASLFKKRSELRTSH